MAEIDNERVEIDKEKEGRKCKERKPKGRPKLEGGEA